MKEIAIIDYGMCNLDSVARAIEKCGGTPQVTDDETVIEEAMGIILPGVGSFHDAMHELTDRKLIDVIRHQVLEKDTPFLGICLGMQLMATTGHEGGDIKGLDLIPGEVVRFIQDTPATRIPHVGWNEVRQTKQSPLLAEVEDGTDFYFVHSYHYLCDEEYVITRTPYCGGFVSAINRNFCFGTQFHPEKSLKAGFQILNNFLALC